jgi:hypothetical protein
MKISVIFTILILVFSYSQISAKCHKHKNIKHELPTIKAGHSKDCGRPKPVTSTEDRKKGPKKDRIGEKKRDRYGAFIYSPKVKSKEYAPLDIPKITKQPRPFHWIESKHSYFASTCMASR